MSTTYRIELDDLDLGQTLGGLQMRAESWEKTAYYLRTGKMSAGEFFIIEECSKPEEADHIAHHYRSIIAKIRSHGGTGTTSHSTSLTAGGLPRRLWSGRLVAAF